jgi:putative UDP-galactose--lipooligosaccharide galactosyltransferase
MYENFSVGMSVYKNDNPNDFIDSVNSVVNQTVAPSEIVLIQDGPVSENLSNAIVKLQDMFPILNVIKLSENIGHAGARQAAMNAASNELVAIMDADDISVPNRFELQLQAFALHPEASVVGGQISEFIENKENVVGERIVPLEDSEIKTYLKSRCPMNLVTVMYRKKDVKAVGGFMDWYCEEDYYLWLRLAQAGYKFYNIDENLVNVRVGKEMYQRRGGWRYFKSEARLQWYMFRNGIISFPRYSYNTLGRLAVQVMMPNKLRGFIFQKLFRK